MRYREGLILLFLNSVGHAQVSVPPDILTLERDFDKKVASALDGVRRSMAEPTERFYLDALKRGMKQAQDAGDLGSAQAFASEIEQIDSAGVRASTIPVTPEKSSPALAKIKKVYMTEIEKYEEEVRRRLDPIVQDFQRRIGVEVENLTRQGKLDEADRAKRAQANAELAKCRIGGGSVAVFVDGERPFVNRDYVWVNLPSRLSRLNFVPVQGGVPQSFVIEVERPGTLYVGVGDDDAHEAIQLLQSQGFKDTGETYQHTPRGGAPGRIFSKFVVQSFTLPKAPGAFSGFTIIGILE